MCSSVKAWAVPSPPVTNCAAASGAVLGAESQSHVCSVCLQRCDPLQLLLMLLLGTGGLTQGYNTSIITVSVIRHNKTKLPLCRNPQDAESRMQHWCGEREGGPPPLSADNPGGDGSYLRAFISGGIRLRPSLSPVAAARPTCCCELWVSVRLSLCRLSVCLSASTWWGRQCCVGFSCLWLYVILSYRTLPSPPPLSSGQSTIDKKQHLKLQRPSMWPSPLTKEKQAHCADVEGSLLTKPIPVLLLILSPQSFINKYKHI